MEPTRQERESKEAAELICYVCEQRSVPIPSWARHASKDFYGEAEGMPEDVIGYLCDELRSLDPADRDTVIYGNPRSRVGRQLADWWERHLEDDEEREEIEREAARRDKLREQALQKLTDEEKEALGLDQ